MKTLILTYLWISLASMLCIMIVRIVLMRKLYRIKDEKIFAEGMGMEIFSALVCIPLPFNIPKQTEPATHELVKKINKLKNYYWWLVLGVILVLVGSIVSSS